jgi:hypothetical protein
VSVPSATLIFLSYGDGPHVAETMFAAISAWRLTKPEEVDLVVYTDAPEAFRGIPVRTRTITGKELRHWQPRHSYPRRCKPFVVRDALQRFGRPAALVDSDTWFRRPPRLIFDRVGPGRVALHLDEGPLASSNSQAKRDLAHDLIGDTLRAGDRTVTVRPGVQMWNSGVTGIHPVDAAILDDTVEILDHLWQEYPKAMFLEQFALTRAVELRAVPCRTDDIVYHYWLDSLRRPWRQRLPGLLEGTRDMTPESRAHALHRHRPRVTGRNAVRLQAKRAWRQLGLPTSSVRSSAT